MPEYTSHFPQEMDMQSLYKLLTSTIGPRPIALVSTIGENCVANLAPFSYFNMFSIKPPVVAIGPTRSGRSGQLKDTSVNIGYLKELVVNIVNFSMVEQANLASTEYPADVDEFTKSGFTPVSSETVKPFRVAESPVHFECMVLDVVEFGDSGGAGQMILAKVQCLHIDNAVVDSLGNISPDLLDLVGRLGQNWYCRASGKALFEVGRVSGNSNIGIDGLPTSIKHSTALSGNELGKLGGLSGLPTEKELNDFLASDSGHWLNGNVSEVEVLTRAKSAIQASNAELALKILIAGLK
jgi:flavin reductase (DIM6/NTAB) family NADH-FMN oxidoreductase RutF